MIDILIAKSDTPCTLISSAWRVPQAEPINFAKAIIDAHAGTKVNVKLLGHCLEHLDYNGGAIDIIPYFGQPETLTNYINEDTNIVYWQGTPIWSYMVSEEPNDFTAHVYLQRPFAAGLYWQRCGVKVWTVLMFNLMCQLPTVKKKYFLLTDSRVPLIDMHKIDPIACPYELPDDIELITQNYYHAEYAKWYKKYCWGGGVEGFDISEYTYDFKATHYLPLHALPYWSHHQFAKPLTEKTGCSIFQAQSIKYMDDYRIKGLAKALNYVNGYCTLHGKFRPDEIAIVQTKLSKYADRLIEHIIDNHDNADESFIDSAAILANHQASLIITDGRYERFGLCPNRLMEALSVGSVPLIVPGVLRNCEPFLKSVIENIDIHPEKTNVLGVSNGKYEVVFNYQDNQINMETLSEMLLNAAETIKNNALIQFAKLFT